MKFLVIESAPEVIEILDITIARCEYEAEIFVDGQRVPRQDSDLAHDIASIANGRPCIIQFVDVTASQIEAMRKIQ